LYPDKIEDFDKENTILLNEDFVIDENESNRAMIETLNDVLLNSEIELFGTDAILYDKWCTIFEEATERYVLKDSE
jgi:hypothetical protein